MNIYDVAKHAGVSTATVSRVINNPKNVNEKTKNRVLKSIKDLDYTPSSVARSLATSLTDTIGLMVPDVRDPFHAKASFLLEQLLYKKGYSSILCNTSTDPDQQRNYFKLLNSQKVDGIIAIGSVFLDKQTIEQIENINSKMPIILLNNSADNIYSIELDVDTGIKEALKYLKSTHKENVLYVKHDVGYKTKASKKKEKAFLKYSKDIFGRDSLIYNLKYNADDYQVLIEFLESNRDINGIIFEKDILAVMFMRYAYNADIKVPENISIIGFDNLDITNMPYKAISSIDHRIEEMCNNSVDVLMNLLEDNKPCQNSKIICSKFIPKETT